MLSNIIQMVANGTAKNDRTAFWNGLNEYATNLAKHVTEGARVATGQSSATDKVNGTTEGLGTGIVNALESIGKDEDKEDDE